MAAGAGYSGTPLAKKLGIRTGHAVAVLDEPAGFRRWLAPLPEGVLLRRSLGRTPDIVVAFATDRATLQRGIVKAAEAIVPDGAIWACWPKKSAKLPTDITEDTVRELALPIGLVDNKVCAVSDVWSGLRLVWRLDQRSHRRGTPGTT